MRTLQKTRTEAIPARPYKQVSGTFSDYWHPADLSLAPQQDDSFQSFYIPHDSGSSAVKNPETTTFLAAAQV